jgi:hypothetical protein
MIFNMTQGGNIMKAVCGDLSVGTIVTVGDSAANAK